MKLEHFLFSFVVYPADDGFFQERLAEDLEPLDAVICGSADLPRRRDPRRRRSAVSDDRRTVRRRRCS
jgi:hypothetical protein